MGVGLNSVDLLYCIHMCKRRRNRGIDRGYRGIEGQKEGGDGGRKKDGGTEAQEEGGRDGWRDGGREIQGQVV